MGNDLRIDIAAFLRWLPRLLLWFFLFLLFAHDHYAENDARLNERRQKRMASVFYFQFLHPSLSSTSTIHLTAACSIRHSWLSEKLYAVEMLMISDLWHTTTPAQTKEMKKRQCGLEIYGDHVHAATKAIITSKWFVYYLKLFATRRYQISCVEHWNSHKIETYSILNFNGFVCVFVIIVCLSSCTWALENMYGSPVTEMLSSRMGLVFFLCVGWTENFSAESISAVEMLTMKIECVKYEKFIYYHSQNLKPLSSKPRRCRAFSACGRT